MPRTFFCGVRTGSGSDRIKKRLSNQPTRSHLDQVATARCSDTSSERLFNRGTLLGKKLRSIGSDVKTIFQPHAEFAIDHDRWFIAKAHARLNRCLVAAHKVGPFMTIKADTVSRAMWQPRRPVIRSKACVSQNFSRGIIHSFTGRAHPGGRKTCVL